METSKALLFFLAHLCCSSLLAATSTTPQKTLALSLSYKDHLGKPASLSIWISQQNDSAMRMLFNQGETLLLQGSLAWYYKKDSTIAMSGSPQQIAEHIHALLRAEQKEHGSISFGVPTIPPHALRSIALKPHHLGALTCTIYEVLDHKSKRFAYLCATPLLGASTAIWAKNWPRLVHALASIGFERFGALELFAVQHQLMPIALFRSEQDSNAAWYQVQGYALEDTARDFFNLPPGIRSTPVEAYYQSVSENLIDQTFGNETKSAIHQEAIPSPVTRSK